MGPDRTYHKGDPFGSRDARGRLVLDGRAAAELNAVRAELRRLGKVTIAPPLEYASDAAGRRWGVSRPARVYAKLTGSSSPYTWAEATRSASGVSSLVTGGRSGSAYEVNGATGLGGTYATLDWTPAGDWRFQAIRTGSSAPTHPCGSSTYPDSLTLTWTYDGFQGSSPFVNPCTSTSTGTVTRTFTMPFTTGYGYLSNAILIDDHEWCSATVGCGVDDVRGYFTPTYIRWGIQCSASPSRLYYWTYSSNAPLTSTDCRPGQEFTPSGHDCGTSILSSCFFFNCAVLSTSPLHLQATFSDTDTNGNPIRDTIDVTA